MPLTIEVKGIKAYGKHGIYAEEKKEEQLFLIDVKANPSRDESKTLLNAFPTVKP